jgi:hypothetical protein
VADYAPLFPVPRDRRGRGPAPRPGPELPDDDCGEWAPLAWRVADYIPEQLNAVRTWELRVVVHRAAVLVQRELEQDYNQALARYYLAGNPKAKLPTRPPLLDWVL